MLKRQVVSPAVIADPAFQGFGGLGFRAAAYDEGICHENIFASEDTWAV